MKKRTNHKLEITFIALVAFAVQAFPASPNFRSKQ